MFPDLLPLLSMSKWMKHGMVVLAILQLLSAAEAKSFLQQQQQQSGVGVGGPGMMGSGSAAGRSNYAAGAGGGDQVAPLPLLPLQFTSGGEYDRGLVSYVEPGDVSLFLLFHLNFSNYKDFGLC